jgi:cytochrome c-type biogenesis protein CcmH/NrfG
MPDSSKLIFQAHHLTDTTRPGINQRRSVADVMPFSIVVLLAVTAYAQPAAGTGSKVCAECHATIYNEYRNTPMARSSGAAGSGTFQENVEHGNFFSPRGSVRYQVSKTSAGLEFDFRQGDVEGRRRLDYYIGSGAVGRSYICAIDGFLFQAPVSYYSYPARWDLSPGYERSESVNLIRAVDSTCLDCHASRIQLRPGTVNGYTGQPFLEEGISCERCHGPGEEHVRRMRSGTVSRSLAIENPVRLDPARRDSVCAQCHLAGVVRVAKGGRHGTFRSGELLADFVTVFVWDQISRSMTVNGHYEQLRQSRCWQSSGGKLWCGTCHDPHRVPAQPGKAAFYRSRCLRCHTLASCKGPPDSRARAQNNCVECHMRRTPVRKLEHVAFTDHSMSRTTSRTEHADAPAAIPDSAVLVPFDRGVVRDRDLGLAYEKIALLQNNNLWRSRAFTLLKAVHDTSAEDVKVESALADLYEHMGDEATACKIFARVAASDPADVRASLNLGVCMANQGRLSESVRLWKNGVERDPSQEAARFNLAVAQYRTGDAAGARATLNEALRFNPASRRAREFLIEIGN